MTTVESIDQRVGERNSAYLAQWEGTEPHARGGRDVPGWFYQVPRKLKLGYRFQQWKFPILKVYDYSGRRVTGGKELPSGSFLIEIKGGEGPIFPIFPMFHPDDIKGFLEQSGVNSPQELVGREVTLYWQGFSSQPQPGSRILGVNL